MADGRRTCGDAGGRTRAGDPCGQPAKPGERCRHHKSQAMAERREMKEAFLKAYEEMPVMRTACAKLRKEGYSASEVTVWRMRQHDDEFDRRISELEAAAPEVRYRMVEDSLFLRCATDRGTAAERIFYLVNESRRRGDRRWMDVKEHVFSGKIGLEGFVAQLPPEIVRELMGLSKEERKRRFLELYRERDRLPAS